MTKMAILSVYGKNPLKNFSETEWQMTLKLGMQHWELGLTKFVQMMTLGWPWPILRQGQIQLLRRLCRKNAKKWILSTPSFWLSSKLIVE